MSDSVRPHRWRQPDRLPHPWDSPGKNTGVGCHFLLQCRKVKSESEVAQSCPTLSNPMGCIARQAPLSMGLSRQEYWNELPNPPPGDLPNPGIKPVSPALQVDSLPLWSAAVAAAAKSFQLCPTLCDPIDGGSPLGCPVPGILQYL